MRLPEFLYRLSPVGEVLTALERGGEDLCAEVETRNSRLHVSTADEEGLSLWERDYGLADGVQRGLDARRTRVRTALIGGQTLTPAALKALALSIGRADRAEITEDIAEHSVILHALYDGAVETEALELLREVLGRLKPAHLELRAVTMPPMGSQKLYYRGALAQGLSVARHSLAACANSTHAVFAGGMNSNDDPVSAVDAYNRELSRVSVPALTYSAQLLKGAPAGELLTFSGGCSGGGIVNYGTVNAYDSALTRSTLTGLTTATREHMAASAGGYSVHAGGYRNLNQAHAYDETGAKTVLEGLSAGRGGGAGVTFGNRAVILGGGTAIDAYDETLTRTVPGSLAVSRSYPKAAVARTYLLVTGGASQQSVEVYDGDFVRSSAPDLLFSEVWSGVGLDSYAVFTGGPVNNQLQADAYNALLTRVSVEAPAQPVGGADVTLGTRMLMAGSASNANVESYEVI